MYLNDHLIDVVKHLWTTNLNRNLVELTYLINLFIPLEDGLELIELSKKCRVYCGICIECYECTDINSCTFDNKCHNCGLCNE